MVRGPTSPFPLHDPMRTRLVRLPSPDAIDEYSSTYDALHATWTATMAAMCDRRGAIAGHRQHGGTASASVV